MKKILLLTLLLSTQAHALQEAQVIPWLNKLVKLEINKDWQRSKHFYDDEFFKAYPFESYKLFKTARLLKDPTGKIKLSDIDFRKHPNREKTWLISYNIKDQKKFLITHEVDSCYLVQIKERKLKITGYLYDCGDL